MKSIRLAFLVFLLALSGVVSAGTAVTFNGTSYTIPAAGELNWSALSNFLVDVGQNAALSKTMKQAVRVATTTPVTVSATTDYTVITDLSSAGAVAVNLPAGVNGQLFYIQDGKGDALTNNITITPNGAETIATAATKVLNQNGQGVLLQYRTTTANWYVLAEYIPDKAYPLADAVVITNATNNLTTEASLAVSRGGTSGTTAATARAALSAAVTGANSDITSLSGLTTPLSIAQGGTSGTTAPNAITALGLGTSATVSFGKLGLGTTSPSQQLEVVGSALINGAAGAGFISLAHQSSDVATPGSGSNNVRVFAKSKKLYTSTDDGSGTAIVQEIGSGAGGGSEVNYVSTGTFESAAITGWATYANTTPAATPEDGDGGSPTVTFARTTSGPIIDSASGLFTKDAADRQGEGFNFGDTAGFTTNANDGRILGHPFAYTTSAGYVSGDMVICLYDVTNAALVGTCESLPAATGGNFYREWPTTAGTAYRLIGHVATANAAAYTVKIDNVRFGAEKLVMGEAASNELTYSPTVTGTGGDGTTTYSTQTGRWWRSGQHIIGSLHIRASSVSVAPTGNIGFSLPVGYSVDETLVNDGELYLGSCSYNDASAAYIPCSVHYDTGSHKIQLVSANGTALPTWAGGDEIFADFKVPVASWSSGVYMTRGRDFVGASAYLSSSGSDQTIAAGGAGTTAVVFNSVTATAGHGWNVGGAFNTTTGAFTVPSGAAGKYLISGAVLIAGGDAVSYSSNILVGGVLAAIGASVDGTDYASWSLPFSSVVSLAAGDVVSLGIFYSGATTFTVTKGNGISFIEISRLTDENNQPVSGFKLGSSTEYGLVRDQTKQYLHGGTYNGVALTLTVNPGTVSAGTRGVFIPYATLDGSYRLKFNTFLSVSSTARTAIDVTVPGVTFKNVASYYQPVTGIPTAGATLTSAPYVNPGAGTISAAHASFTTTGYWFSGDVELDSKPTWMD